MYLINQENELVSIGSIPYCYNKLKANPNLIAKTNSGQRITIVKVKKEDKVYLVGRRVK